jgi:hypothetical protein
MVKITVETYKSDKYYPKVVRAVAAILAKGDVVAPIDVFIQMDLLSAADVEAWRFRRVPYLERSIRCSLGKANRILRILRMHAHDLNMRPSVTAYVSWGKGARTPLRFSKTGESALEKAYSLHFLSPSLRPRSKGSVQGEAEATRHETAIPPVQVVEATTPEISSAGEQ